MKNSAYSLENLEFTFSRSSAAPNRGLLNRQPEGFVDRHAVPFDGDVQAEGEGGGGGGVHRADGGG